MHTDNSAKLLAVRDGSEKQVSAEAYLNPHDNVVLVEVPLAAANSYYIYLPPVGDAPGAEYTFVAVRASGTYVDGEVVVKDRGDGVGGGLTMDGMTKTADRIHIKNCGGKFYTAIVDVTT